MAVLAILREVPKPYLGESFLEISFAGLGSYWPGPGTITYVLFKFNNFVSRSKLAPILEKLLIL